MLMTIGRLAALFVLLSALSFSLAFSQAFSAEVQLPPDYVLHFKGRTNLELREFIHLSALTGNIRSLSPSSPLSALGWDVGLEFTSVPQNVFQFKSGHLELPKYFPRLNFAKGLTENLDLEGSILTTLLFGSARVPEALTRLWLYGGALKYTILNESDFWISLAGRATYARLDLPFLEEDIFGADASISRGIKVSSLPALPITLTPYLGAGYVSTIAKFDQRRIPYAPLDKQRPVQGYRYFSGLSFKFSMVDFTFLAESSRHPKKLRTYSFKMSVDI
jgi:hypothetical protein